MRIAESRTASFIVLFVIYLLASAVGIILCYLLPWSFYVNLLLADVIATVFVFAFSLIFSNASVYDPYWSVQPVVITVGYAAVAGLNAAGIIVLSAIAFWSVRLTANWAYTFKGLRYQDWRYTMLYRKTRSAYPIINFVGIHLVPTLVVYACTLPAVFVILYAPQLKAVSLLFTAVSVGAVVLQGTADVQMHEYRNNRTSPFMRRGLWKYSRHPNYLGEILMWWGVALFSFSLMPNKWFLLIGAFINTLLFLLVSIPMADKRQSEKEGFEAYKAETRMLLPIKK